MAAKRQSPLPPERSKALTSRPFPKGLPPARLRFSVRRRERTSSSRQDGAGVDVRTPGASALTTAPASGKNTPGPSARLPHCPCEPSREWLVQTGMSRRWPAHPDRPLVASGHRRTREGYVPDPAGSAASYFSLFLGQASPLIEKPQPQLLGPGLGLRLLRCRTHSWHAFRLAVWPRGVEKSSPVEIGCLSLEGRDEHNKRFYLIKGLHLPFTHSVPQRRRALPVAPETSDSWVRVPSRPVSRAPAQCPAHGPRPPRPQYLCRLFCRSPGKRHFVPEMLGMVLLADFIFILFWLGGGKYGAVFLSTHHPTPLMTVSLLGIDLHIGGKIIESTGGKVYVVNKVLFARMVASHWWWNKCNSVCILEKL